MSRHEICSSDKTTTRKTALQPTKRSNLLPKQQPVTISEKVNDLEKKFAAVIAELERSKDQFVDSKKEIVEIKADNVELRAQLENVVAELKLSKDQLVDSKKEVAELREENVGLRTNLAAGNDLIQNVNVEICKLKKKLESKGEGPPHEDMERNVAKSIFKKLPCGEMPQLIFLKSNIEDQATNDYIVSIFTYTL